MALGIGIFRKISEIVVVHEDRQGEARARSGDGLGGDEREWFGIGKFREVNEGRRDREVAKT
jgi:hypothetical protein